MSNEDWKIMDIDLLEAVRSTDSGQLSMLVNTGNAENYCMSFAAGKNNILHVAASFGSTDCARSISRQISSTTLERLLVQRNCRGNTPLHYAALVHNSYLVKFFLSKMNDVGIEMKNNMGDTALHLAAAGDSHQDLKITEVLLERCQRLGKEDNASKEYPVYIAAERGSLEILQYLLKFPDFPTTGPGGKTALHAALARRNDGIFRYLVENKKELVVQQDDQGSTPLHYVASCGDQEMTRLLLNVGRDREYLQLRSDHVAHISDNNGTSPIHVAAHQGHVEVIRWILQFRPDSCELVDESGGNFLHVAVKQGRTNVVKYVIEESKSKHLLSNQEDNNGDTPLHLAVRKHNLRMVNLLLKIEKLSKVLRNSDGMTVLDLMDSELASSRYLIKLSLIGNVLLKSGSEFSARRMDNLQMKCYQDEWFSRFQRSSRNIILVSVLIATVTFTAGLTVPGGYMSDSAKQDAGFAVLSNQTIFKVFMTSNAIAMSTSLIATLCLVKGAYFSNQYQVFSLINMGRTLLIVSFVGMVVAFATGTYMVIPPDSKGFAKLVVALFFLIPLFFIVTGLNIKHGVKVNFDTWENCFIYTMSWRSRKILKRGLKWWGSKFSITMEFFL